MSELLTCEFAVLTERLEWRHVSLLLCLLCVSRCAHLDTPLQTSFDKDRVCPTAPI